MLELDLLTQRGSLIKHYQINEIELSCACFLSQGNLVSRQGFRLTNRRCLFSQLKLLNYSRQLEKLNLKTLCYNDFFFLHFLTRWYVFFQAMFKLARCWFCHSG